MLECESRMEGLEINFKKFTELTLWNNGDCSMPLTPPMSPVTFYESSTDAAECDCHRFQPICNVFPESQKDKHDNLAESIVLKDCMWGYGDDMLKADRAKNSCKLQVPLNCSYENAKLVGVDPTEVFPKSLYARLSNLYQQKVSAVSHLQLATLGYDPEVDVISVDNQDAVPMDNDDSDVSMDDYDNDAYLSPPKTPESDLEATPVPPPQIKLVIPIKFSQAARDVPYGGGGSTCTVDVISEADRGEHAAASAPSSISSADEESAAWHEPVTSHTTTAVGDGSSKLYVGRPPRAPMMKLSRASHNILERKRREELKSKFYTLRDELVVSASGKDCSGVVTTSPSHGRAVLLRSMPRKSDKIAKVTILQNAMRLIGTLETEEDALNEESLELQEANKKLKARLLQVTRVLGVRAMKRMKLAHPTAEGLPLAGAGGSTCKGV